MQDEKLLTESQAAEYLNITPRTLQAWRYREGGPPFVRVSERCIRYRSHDLIVWIEGRIRMSTREKSRNKEVCIDN